MTSKLNEELLRAIDAQPGAPVRVIDDRTGTSYVLLRADLYEKVKALLEEDYDLSDTYPAQLESAMRAGWADPAMDEYNDYDAHRK